MKGPPLGPGGEDITWPHQVAPRGRKASSTRKIKPQTSNPPGRQQPFGAGPLDPHPSGGRFVRPAQVVPFPPPFVWVGCFFLDLLVTMNALNEHAYSWASQNTKSPQTSG